MFCQKLTTSAKLPERKSQGAAGYDICSDEDVKINPRESKLIKTGVAISVPEGHYGRIAPRSGFSVKKNTDIGAGVIDCDYTGEIKVFVMNHSDGTVHVTKGDAIAQLIVEKISLPEIIQVPELKKTNRGSGGFGSTDEKKQTVISSFLN